VCLFRTTIRYFYSVSNTLSQRVHRRQHRPTLLVSIRWMTSLFAVCLSLPVSIFLFLSASISLPLSVCVYFAPGRGAKYCDLLVSTSVCLSAHRSQKSRVQTSRNFLYMLSVSVARFCSENTLCTSSFADDILLSHNGPDTDTGR